MKENPNRRDFAVKLLIVRHADPDYSIDSLTPTGWKEAELLADRLSQLKDAAFYCSPLGRARDTARLTMERLGREAQILPWLQEFPAPVEHPGVFGPDVAWDWLPEVWTREPRFYDADRWFEPEEMDRAQVRDHAKRVFQGLDELVESHGYRRDGKVYRPIRPNEDTVVLFCHFGVECVLLSRLLSVSPMPLWHGFCAAPTSVTTVRTEERREGTASFRISAFGDTSHLYIAGREPSVSARFCETYANMDQRHD
jgi:probable phosphoglycerate mutase